METASSSADPETEGSIGPGRVIVIVGPSGAGKDTLIGLARAALADRDDIVLPQRIVTRRSDEAEDNVALSVAEFLRLQAQGGLAVSWQAHGLHYGYSIDIDAAVRRGARVLLNLSRTAVCAVRSRYRDTHVVLIDADRDVRRTRLVGRKRENGDAIEARLARETPFEASDADVIISNDKDEASAAQKLIDVVAAR